MTTSRNVLLLFALMAAPSIAGAQKLKERYSVKVVESQQAPTEFVLKINGEVVGSYDGMAAVDITDRMKAGKNTVVVTWKALAPIKPAYATTTLTLGVYRNGKWSTAFTVSSRKATPKGSRTTVITAR